MVDLFCQSIFEKPVHCTMFVNTEYRYYYAPSSDSCCKCCPADVCGVLKPTWLMDNNATYVGSKVISGLESFGWLVGGDQLRYWWQSADGVPTAFTVSSASNESLVGFYYDPSTFKAAPIDPDIFDLPSACEGSGMCPTTSLCSSF